MGNMINGRAVSEPNSQSFWSAGATAYISLSTVATDISLLSVVVSGIPVTATIQQVTAMLKYREAENTNASANKLNGAQEIQVKHSAGSWIDAINLLDDSIAVAADAVGGGDVLIGSIDIKAQVTGNGTYNFQWDEAVADLANIVLRDIQVGLRIRWTE